MIPFVILTLESEEDRAYMTLIYQRHRALMLKIAWEFTREKADVEDIVSDSCVALINNLDALRALESHHQRKYIAVTVRRKAIDLTRRRQREQAALHSADETTMAKIPDPENLEKKVLLLEELRQVQCIIRQLPQREQDVLRMKYQLGMKQQDIAEILGITESTVSTYTKRARAHLRAALY